MTLSAIWAQDRHGVIGSGTGMLWHVPADLAFFKATTMGAPVIMGRSSWEALGGPLPGRRNIVLTRKPGYIAQGAEVAASLDEALASVASEDAWITGGSQIYHQTLDLVDQLVVTDLDLDAGPGVHAPHIDPDLWAIDQQRSDDTWRPRSGDARWKVTVYTRKDSPRR